MTDRFGKRVDEGCVFTDQHGKQQVLLYSCPYAIVLQKRFYCPYREEARKASVCDMYTHCPKRATDASCICYKTQELDHFIKQHGINAIKNKEDIKMELSNVKDARRLPNGTSIAVDDVVRVTISYNKELYCKFGNKNSVDGRIVRFCDKGFELDISERFNSNVVSLRYDNLSSLYPVTEETKC